MHVTFYDTKSYDREFFTAQAAGGLDLLFHEFRLNAANAASAEGEAVCVFVNDLLDRPCLKILAARGVKLAALRCHQSQVGGHHAESIEQWLRQRAKDAAVEQDFELAEAFHLVEILW
jgi:LmbE family N-acetylglucosaminyl deacetylase